VSIDEKEIGIKIGASTKGFAEATRDVSGLDNAISNMQGRVSKAMKQLESSAKQVEGVFAQSGQTTGARQVAERSYQNSKKNIDDLRKMGYNAEADAYEKRLDPGAANVSANQDRLREALDYRLKDSPRYKKSELLSRRAMETANDPATRRIYEGMAKEEATRAIAESKVMRETIMKQIGTVRDPIEQRRQIDKVAEEAGVEKDLIIAQGINKRGTGRMLPAYIGTVLNMAGQVVNAYADMAVAEKTMFNIGSPQGMVLTTLQKEIFETKRKYQMLNLLGTGAGMLIGSTMAGPAGAWAGAYLGGQITEPITSAMGKYNTMDKEQMATFLSQIFPQMDQSRGALESLQESQYGLSRFFPNRRGTRRFSANFGSYSPDDTTGMLLRGQYGSGAITPNATETDIARGSGIRTPGEGFFRGVNQDFTGMGFSDAQQNSMLTGFLQKRGGAGGNAYPSFASLTAYAAKMGLPPELLYQLSGIQKYTGMDFGGAGYKNLVSRTNMGSRDEDLISAVMQNIGKSSTAFMTPQGMTGASYMLGLPGAMFGTGTEAGKLGQQGQGNINAISELGAPQSNAHRALMYMAIAGGSGKGQSFMDINLRMRQGIMNKSNLLDILSVIPRNRNLAQAYFASMMPDASADLVNRMADMQASGSLYTKISGLQPLTGGNLSSEMINNQINDAGGNIPPGRKEQAIAANKRATSYESVQADMYRVELDSVDMLTKVMSTSDLMVKVIGKLHVAIDDTRNKLIEIDKNLFPEIPPSGKRPGHPVPEMAFKWQSQVPYLLQKH